MPSLTPLSPDQIADLFGALDDFIGTGNNIITDFQTTYFPLVDTKKIDDELTGVGDGVTTVYQLFFFPIDAGTLELRKTAINGTLLVLTTHYTVNLTTGVVTLTPAGVALLGTEQLHSKYHATTTIALHSGTISGPLLTPTTHYTLSPRTGKVKLTPAGVVFLGVAQLHAKYQVVRGLVNVFTDANGGLRAGEVTVAIQRDLISTKDSSLKYLHETIESKAILHLEVERKQLQVATAIVIATVGNFVQPAETVNETAIVDSVETPYQAVFGPLYPSVGAPNTPDPAKPFKPNGLFGGSGVNNNNEEQEIIDELAATPAVQAAGADVAGNPGPSPARSGWYKRYDQALITMIPKILDQQTALAGEVAGLTAFLADNPTPTDLILTGDITNATTALANATAQIAANTAFLAAIPYPSAGPFPGLSNANLAARAAAQAARQAQIATRKGQLTTLLTLLYNTRFFYIEMRTRLSDGTRRKFYTLGVALTVSQNQVIDNTARISQILTLLAGQ